ncbi:MAG: diguanylate cyclase [Pseudomonadota bacterium]|uniref:diguanylate cyclase n=1 Tax=Candidatus Desulfatibia profunda TaxID=2841695 RepID=A0A8J6TMD9_9BACT|nr:diguanylate cyclase [Candidatus Desulfatibia profunda]MBL7180618.1 diguanylate cyclase [Desulfobacterales bacterium]
MADHILIVDDDAAIRDSMQQFMERSGFNTFTASSAEETLQLLKTNSVEVIITDIILPGKDGLMLTDAVKKKYNIDVIVMTGYSGNYSYEEAISKGASDFVFKPVRFEEVLLRLKRVLRERQLTKERVQILGKLEKLAITDGLTTLYNLRHFYNQLEIEVGRSNRYGHSLGLLLLDIDHFKVYNDSFGHLEGDKVLIRLGQIIRSCLRTMDSAYRYGGEEFTIILPETGGEEAKTVAHRIRNAVKAAIFFPEPDKPQHVTISVGVTEYCNKEELTTFIQRADKAMYLSKLAGRNKVSSLFAEQA